MRAAVFVERVNRAISYFKMAAWTLFSIVGPCASLLMHNFLGVLIMGLIAIFIGRFAFGPDMHLFRGSRLLGDALVAQGLVFSLYGAYVLFSPATPWTREIGAAACHLLIKKDGTIHGVELTEKPSGFLTLTAGSKTWDRVEFPGNRISEAYLSEDGTTILAKESETDRVFLLGENHFELIQKTKGALIPLSKCPDLGPTPFPAALCERTSSGATWIAKSGMFEGQLAFSENGSAYRRLSLPAPRPEALSVKPSNHAELWIAFWGSGVYRTTDAGRTWTYLGLKGSEVRSLVVDFQRRRAFASTGTAIYSLAFQ